MNENERGIISLTALCIMAVLAIAIATVENIAARQADIVRYYRLENALQAVAEGYFNEAVLSISENAENISKSTTILKDDSIDIENGSSKIKIYVKVYAKKIVYSKGAENKNAIAIMSLAELPNYNYGSNSIHRKVSGYMTKVDVDKTVTTEDDSEVEKYEFTGYFD